MKEHPSILLIEDEEGLVMTLRDRLEAEGYRVDSATNGQEGYDLALKQEQDLILLDIMLPGKNGFDICRDLRASHVRTPILMLTAKGQIADRVMGLKLGADDYLSKPFDMNELLARIEAILRRIVVPSSEQGKPSFDWSRVSDWGVKEFEGFSVDFGTGMLVREGEQYQLASQEFKLLAYLCSHPERIVSRDELLHTVWDYDKDVTTRTVDVHVAWLRRKLGDSDPLPRHIQTVRGLGYRFVP